MMGPDFSVVADLNMDELEEQENNRRELDREDDRNNAYDVCDENGYGELKFGDG